MNQEALEVFILVNVAWSIVAGTLVVLVVSQINRVRVRVNQLRGRVMTLGAIYSNQQRAARLRDGEEIVGSYTRDSIQ